MYLTHPVRRIREDPIEGETVRLLLDVADGASVETVAADVEAVGATVERERQFDTLEVTVAHEDVDAVCSVDGIDAIETAATMELDPDGAGEDVRFDAE